jgi:hypothetical protein
MLVQNPFGNYALQTAFECWPISFAYPIIEQFYGRLYNLSMHKYSSNVIEKCIQLEDERIITRFAEETCNSSRIIGIIFNLYIF